MMTADIPAPLEWHPYYRDKTWLLDWLEQRGPYADLYVMRLPVRRRMTLTTAESDPTVPTMQELQLTRRRCWGLAPYVGQPFVYVWPVGEDNLGRYIAGEAKIVYE